MIVTKNIARLHYLTQDWEGRSHAEQARLACEGGANWVQFRSKSLQGMDLIAAAIAVKEVCAEFDATLIINDDPLLAQKIGAQGVHLGKSDMPVSNAREILGDDFIIGGTTNEAADIETLIAAGADYIGVGPFRHTITKAKLSPILGLEGFAELAKQFAKKIPMIGIGGIDLEDTESILETQVHGIAVASGINLSDDPVQATKKYLSKINLAHA